MFAGNDPTAIKSSAIDSAWTEVRAWETETPDSVARWHGGRGAKRAEKMDKNHLN